MNRLFSKKKPPLRVQDELFGTLTFVEATSDEGSYWLSSIHFKPIAQLIDCQLYADVTGFTPQQKQFYLRIEERYADLAEVIETFINAEIERIDPKFGALSIKKDLQVERISIPIEIEHPETNWSITYESNKGFAFYTIECKDWQPNWLSISA